MTVRADQATTERLAQVLAGNTYHRTAHARVTELVSEFDLVLAELVSVRQTNEELHEARETIRERALVLVPSGQGRTSFNEGFFDGMMEAVRIIDAALASGDGREPADTKDSGVGLAPSVFNPDSVTEETHDE